MIATIISSDQTSKVGVKIAGEMPYQKSGIGTTVALELEVASAYKSGLLTIVLGRQDEDHNEKLTRKERAVKHE